MPDYDPGFSPPAPVILARLRDLRAGAEQSEIPMQMDSGADVTLLPRGAVDSLNIERSNRSYELIRFDGTTTVSQAVQAELVLAKTVFRGQFLLVDQEVGILGRDILNHLCLVFDGPALHWHEQPSAKKT
jgi:hypothetical protein